jgi:hypothetical protein
MDRINVSWCHGAFDTNVTTSTLADWLAKTGDTAAPCDKKQADALMPHGHFVGRRAAGLGTHSGYVQIDIDAKDNPGIDPRELRDLIGEDAHCGFSQLSFGLRGVWALFRVAGISAVNHATCASHVVAYVEDRFGVVCDAKVSRNLASLRFRSMDSDFIVNPTPQPFQFHDL